MQPQNPVSPQPATPQAIPQMVPKLAKKFNFKAKAPLILGVAGVIAAGILTGWLLSGGGSEAGSKANVPGSKTGLKEAGLADESTFKDSAEGVLESGGVDGEGTHHLVRPGGDSQNVYLTSTVIDLESFVGKKVEVWGQTIAAQEAGWLMDVGKVKVVE